MHRTPEGEDSGCMHSTKALFVSTVAMLVIGGCTCKDSPCLKNAHCLNNGSIIGLEIEPNSNNIPLLKQCRVRQWCQGQKQSRSGIKKSIVQCYGPSFFLFAPGWKYNIKQLRKSPHMQKWGEALNHPITSRIDGMSTNGLAKLGR